MNKFQNESTADRLVRLALGVVFILLAMFVLTGILQIIAYVAAVVSLFTAATGFCALYKLFGFTTKK